MEFCRIYLTLPAESYDSVEGILGGDSGNLTAKGRQYSIDIARYIQVLTANATYVIYV